MKKRVWELDAFRGLCVLGMIAVHFVYDLVDLYRFVDWEYPAAFTFIKNWGGVLFLLISGICVTLGKRSVFRGAVVLGCGLLVSAVTAGMYLLNFSGKGIIIYFGVLHCLGICMLVWPLFKKAPVWVVGICAALLIGLGLYFRTFRVDSPFLFPLGLMDATFASSDYFPLLPNLGFFLVGAILGKTLYRDKKTLLPRVNEQNFVIRALSFCGRHSLWIYLLHQPILTAVFELGKLLC